MKFLLIIILTTEFLFAQNEFIPFEALNSQNKGIAAWNSDGIIEPNRQGHKIPFFAPYNIVAYYYLASVDYDNINSAADASALRCTGNIVGFPHFENALRNNGFTVSDITMKFTLQSLGNDVQGQDWDVDWNTHIETRTYTGGKILFYLNGEKMVGRGTIVHHLTINYNDFFDQTDDEISGYSDFTLPADSSEGSSAAVRACASAFLSDIGFYGVRIIYNSIQPAIQSEFRANGRTGAYFEAPEGRIEKGNDVLPVELVSFSASVTKNNVLLKWQTVTEINNYGFDVEREGDAGWGKIGFVSGHGNSELPQYYSFSDNSPLSGSNYYRLKQIDFNGTTRYSAIVSAEVISPEKVELLQNFPNPFNPSTKIRFMLPESRTVTLEILNNLGQVITTLIKNDSYPAGYHEVTFDAKNIPSGLYFYRLISDEFISTNKMMLLK